MNKIKKLFLYTWYDCQHITKAQKNRNSPIFIIGCGHSGTSIMQRIVGAHSKIFPVIGESGCAISKCESVFRKAVRNFEKQTAIARCLRWSEKTPKHLHSIEFISSVMPSAKFVAMIRDARDVCNSIKKRYDDIEIGIKRWVRDNTLLLNKLENNNIHLVKYEDLISSPAETMNKCMHFLGDEFQPEQLQFHNEQVEWYAKNVNYDQLSESQKSHNKIRENQINQPLFDGRMKWKKELTCSELDKVILKTKDISYKFGYIY